MRLAVYTILCKISQRREEILQWYNLPHCSEYPCMFSPNQNKLYTLAQKYGFTYIDGDTDSAIRAFLDTSGHSLKRRTRRNFWHQLNLASSIRKARSASRTSDEAISRLYDQEYGGGNAQYGYTSAILTPEGFELITGLKLEQPSNVHIIDVGAGSNEFLRFCRDTLRVPSSQLHGIDVSSASRDIIISDGFTGHLGRLEELNLSQEMFDIAYLSYFIDYDTNQAATFNATIDLIKPGGRIVLEGLFPVRPFALLENITETFSFITRGVTVEEDIVLVMESFIQLGKAKGRNVRLEKVVKTHRFVHSHYGFRRLPSHFLTFSVSE